MGFFSWMASDTGKSIANHYSNRPTFTVHMITEDGRVFTEPNYEGYGVFGGKDFYALAAELNGFTAEDDDKTRHLFFDKIWKRGVRKGDKVLTYRDDFENYESKVQVEGIGEVTPNQLVKDFGWEYWDVGITSNTQAFVDAGFKMPKIVENLPADVVKEWDSIPYPESCPDQGYFYADDVDECPDCGNEMDGGTCYHCGYDEDDL